tara:strand:- start:550 stop:1803 length:1254 start_codon:yes stop_codon:yes gene_type:complete
MATTKLKGVFYNAPITEIENAETINGEQFFRDRKVTDQIPFRFTRGKSSVAEGGFFDESKVGDSDLKIIKLDKKYNYVGIKFSKFKEMMLNYINSTASSTAAALQMSGSFFKDGRLGNLLDDNAFITFIEEDNSQISTHRESGTDSKSGAPTIQSNDAFPRLIFQSAGSDGQSSGIVNSDGYIDITFKNTSSFATNASYSFDPGGASHTISQRGYTSSFKHRFFNTGSIRNGIALSGSESGSIRGKGTVKYVNDSNSVDGRYVSYLVKAKIYGDGEYDPGSEDSSDFRTPDSVVFVPIKELIVYQNNVIISSGSFRYNSSSKAVASSSGITTTLFYQSGSNGPSGSFTGSNVNQGSHIFLNNTLTTPASSGYYAVSGGSDVLHAFKGGLTNDVIGSVVGSSVEFQIPRFVSRSTGPF